MALFRSTLSNCNLWDLGYKGQKYTWTNGRDGRALTLERLDRVIANLDWCGVFDVDVLPRYFSDHSPLLISFDHSKKNPLEKEQKISF
jgi:hypothetical protein